MALLRDVFAHLDDYPTEDPYEPGPTIFAMLPWQSDSVARVLNEDPFDGTTPAAPELNYVLEVSIAQEVLTVWSAWRAGATPTIDEAVEAVLHYATHDSYLPVT